MNTISYDPESVFLHIRIKAKKRYIDDVLLLLYDTIAPTHKEEGCLEYRLLHEGTSILLYGKWKNKMALDMHLLLQFHLDLFENVLPSLCKNISVKRYKEVDPPITSLSIS